jgi:predicted AAA+ superfamily ATPase
MNKEYTIKRHLEKQVIECIKEAKVPCLIGQRQVGKSTLLRELLPQINNYEFVRLDDATTRNDAMNDPAGFLGRHKKPLCIDEVQKAPQLFEAIKDIVDDSSEKGQYVLTGSESLGIMKGIGDSLSTRARILKMLPLSYSEIAKRENFVFVPNIDNFSKRKTKTITELEIFNNIIKGSMPDIINGSTKNITRFYETYCETTIFKDLKEDMVRVQSQSKFLKFLKALASYTSQEINYSNIAKVVDIDDKRIKA